ncbi:MAG: hypothetical protein J3R72DRAFT_523091 [Linnemannia gamsii]|nr:MAG: hypothetical protein J3R72DRAFT_523091 [Linnemannia gamsii]
MHRPYLLNLYPQDMSHYYHSMDSIQSCVFSVDKYLFFLCVCVVFYGNPFLHCPLIFF